MSLSKILYTLLTCLFLIYLNNQRDTWLFVLSFQKVVAFSIIVLAIIFLDLAIKCEGKLYIHMGTYCAPLIVDLFWYERDFMLSL